MTIVRARSFAPLAAVVAASLSLAPATARAELTFVRGQFTDRVERGQPVGDAAAARARGAITFWFVMNNSDAPTQVTLVWRINGNVARRQSIDIGQTPRWRTWGSLRAGRSAQVSVEILDAGGRSLHTETLAP